MYSDSTGTPALRSAASINSVCSTGAMRSSPPAARNTGTLMRSANRFGDVAAIWPRAPIHWLANCLLKLLSEESSRTTLSRSYTPT